MVPAFVLPLFLFADSIAMLVTAWLEHMIAVLAWVFKFDRMAARSGGITRASHAVAAISAAHLFSAMAIPIAAKNSLVMLSWVYAWPTILISLVLFIHALALPVAIDWAERRRTEPELAMTSPVSRIGVTLLLTLLFFVTPFMFWTSQGERTDIRFNLCEVAAGRVPDGWKDRGEVALGWAERLFHREIGEKLPCRPKA